MIGTKLAHYEITAHLGSGGMGDVYQATDTKLGRRVAVKFLPEAFARDTERLARFEREARVLASLNHPNIAAIHGMEEADGKKFLVMELVDGETLADRIARGPVPLDEAIGIARQITESLEAAHASGIVHRDLKPANIKVRADGTVKVLDFGLAKALDEPKGSSPQGLESSPTITSPAMTMRGVILGTAAYMSPEQARGKAVDKRTDIFAFGCVLFEMLTGRRAFDGEDVADILSRVIQREPDWDLLPASVPPRVVDVLRLCLEKNLRTRRSDIADVRIDLDLALSTSAIAAGPASPSGSRSRERLLMTLAATALVALAVVSYLWYPRPSPPPEPIAFTIAPPPGQLLEGASFLSVSPDGRQIAYVTGNGRELWVRDLASPESRRLDRAEAPWSPVWSPDGRSIAFVSRVDTRGLRVVDVSTGQVRTLAPDASPARPAWNQEGIILFQSRRAVGTLYQVSDHGGTPAVVTEADPSRGETFITRPVFLPGGRRYLVLVSNTDRTKAGVYLASLDTPGKTLVVNTMSNVEYAGGYLFYNREATLVAHPFDADTGRLTGEPVTVADNLQFNPSGNGAFAVSESGVLAFVTGDQLVRRLMLLDRSGNSGRQIGAPGPYNNAELSPDGSLAVVEGNAGAQQGRETGPAARRLALIDMARGILMPFTPGDNDEYDATWSPDGSSVVFASRREGTFGIYRRGAGGAATNDELIYSSPERVAPVDVSSDGTLLLFVRGQGPDARLWVLPTSGNRTPVEAFPGAAGRHDQSAFSPDARWIAYSAIEDLESEVYVQPYPADGRRIRISTSTGINPRWTPDGRRIVYRALDGAFYAVDLNPEGRTFRPSAPVHLFSQPPQSPTDVRYGADARLEKFLLTLPLDRAGAPATPITVMVNFVQGLRKK